MSETAPIVYLIDDDESIRTAFSRMLETAGFKVCCYENAGEYLMKANVASHGCLILDVRMPGPSGLELQKLLKEKGFSLPIIFLTGHGDIPMSVQAIKEGAVDFLTKPVGRETLLRSINLALEKNREHLSKERRINELYDLFEKLSPREKIVLKQVASGMKNKEIASELDVSERTIKASRASIVEKLGVESLVDLIRIVDELRRSHDLDF